MSQSPAGKRVVVVLLVAAFLNSSSGYGQKPADNPAPAPTISLGPYYALLIGNNNYRHLSKLQTAANDATSMAKLLEEQYGFKERKLLLNATRNDIFTALSEYRHALPENSNLLIYYAGHGYHDPDTGEAYWLPVDAEPDNPQHWISANDITSNVRAIPAKHVLIISDSCYSGVLTRSADAEIRLERDTYLSKVVRSKSRNLLSSGGDEPVVDTGVGGHSVFANAVLKYLTEMDDDQFTAADLFPKIKRGVAGRSPQVPQYSFIRNSGDEFGDFVFSRGGKEMLMTAALDEPRRKYRLNQSQLPDIACKRELIQGGAGPKIQEGDMVPCKMLDEPLKWLTSYPKPQLGNAAPAQWKAMLIVTVNEDGRVTDIKPRGGANLQDTEVALKAAAQTWQTNPPTFRGMRVRSSFALDIDFGP